MNFDDDAVRFRAIVVQLGDWDALTASRDSTEQDRDRKRARLRQIWEWANHLEPDLREIYHRVLTRMDGTWVEWEDTREFQRRVASVQLPELPPPL